MSVYSSSGTAFFRCPYINRKMKLHYAMPERQRPQWDSEAHSEWVFTWHKGDWTIMHDENGIPKCTACGKELVYVSGDDPF